MRIKLGWLLHNLVGHPVSGVLAFLGCDKVAALVHDSTVPPGIG